MFQNGEQDCQHNLDYVEADLKHFDAVAADDDYGEQNDCDYGVDGSKLKTHLEEKIGDLPEAHPAAKKLKKIIRVENTENWY